MACTHAVYYTWASCGSVEGHAAEPHTVPRNEGRCETSVDPRSPAGIKARPQEDFVLA
jgi:hypothetical protein